MKLVFLKSFATVFDAEAAKKILEAEKIKAIFQTHQGAMIGYGNLIGGELYVRAEDLDKARAILEEI